MLAFYALFVAYLVAYERFKTAAMHIEESQHYQHAESRRLAEEAAATAVLHHSIMGLATVPDDLRQHAFATSAAAWPSFSANAHVVSAADAAAATASERGAASSSAQRTTNGTAAQQRSSNGAQGQHVPAHQGLAGAGSNAESTTSSDDAHDALLPQTSLPVSSPPGSPARQLSMPASDELPDRQPSAAAAQAPEQRTASQWLLAPVIALLRLTMPEVGVADHVSYPKAFAVLLPVSCPLFVVVAKGLAFQRYSPLGVDAVLYGALCSAFSSAVIFSIYPRDGKHYGILSGFFTALTFCMSILWMNIAAGAHAPVVACWVSGVCRQQHVV